MYTVHPLMIKGGLTPILSFLRKHGFVCGIAVQIFVASSIALSGSLSFGLWHREVIAYSAFKTASIAAEQRALRDDL